MALLSWDQIVASTDFPTEYVDVPEWGDGAQVRVRGLSMKDRNDWQRLQMKSVEDDTSAPDADAHLVALAMINADGGRVCKDPAQQSDEIAALRSDIVSRLSRKVMDLSGLGEDDAKDAEKNSETIPTSDSDSNSPSDSGDPTPS